MKRRVDPRVTARIALLQQEACRQQNVIRGHAELSRDWREAAEEVVYPNMEARVYGTSFVPHGMGVAAKTAGGNIPIGESMKLVQHVSNNHVMHASDNMDVLQCRPAPVTIVPYDYGTLGYKSFWKPSPEELAILNAGGYVDVEMLGGMHPTKITASF